MCGIEFLGKNSDEYRKIITESKEHIYSLCPFPTVVENGAKEHRGSQELPGGGGLGVQRDDGMS